MRTGKTPSQRQLRVAEQIRQALALMLSRSEFYDPDLSGISITVTEVSLSPDLKNAVAYMVPLGDNDGEKIMKALNRNATQFKHYISKNIEMRTHPKIHFRLDTAFDYAAEIDVLMNKPKVQQDLEKPTKTEDDEA